MNNRPFWHNGPNVGEFYNFPGQAAQNSYDQGTQRSA